MAVTLVAVLVSLAFWGYEPVKEKAFSVICISKIKSIHSGLTASLSDNGIWPQAPNLAPEALDEWWINTLKPYGVTQKTWICPTMKQLASANGDTTSALKSSYVIARFDDKPNSAYKYQTQPWLIEKADFHRNGPNVCFPDGSVQSLESILNKKNQINENK